MNQAACRVQFDNCVGFPLLAKTLEFSHLSWQQSGLNAIKTAVCVGKHSEKKHTNISIACGWQLKAWPIRLYNIYDMPLNTDIIFHTDWKLIEVKSFWRDCISNRKLWCTLSGEWRALLCVLTSSWTHMTLYTNIINTYYTVTLYWCNIDDSLSLFPNVYVVKDISSFLLLILIRIVMVTSISDHFGVSSKSPPFITNITHISESWILSCQYCYWCYVVIVLWSFFVCFTGSYLFVLKK